MLIDELTCPECKYPHIDPNWGYCPECGYNLHQFSSEDADDGTLDTSIKNKYRS